MVILVTSGRALPGDMYVPKVTQLGTWISFLRRHAPPAATPRLRILEEGATQISASFEVCAQAHTCVQLSRHHNIHNIHTHIGTHTQMRTHSPSNHKYVHTTARAGACTHTHTHPCLCVTHLQREPTQPPHDLLRASWWEERKPGWRRVPGTQATPAEVGAPSGPRGLLAAPRPLRSPQ